MLWLADTFEPKAKKLNIFTRKRIQGRLDVSKLNTAFAALLKKHTILSYRVSKFHPNHYLQKHKGFKVVEQNLALLSDTESELVIEDSFQQLKNFHPWPKNKPQIMTRLFYLKDNTTELQISMPHLIADDMCPDILLKDLSYYYYKSSTEQSDVKNVYNEYIAQEQHYIKKHLPEDSSFWDAYLKESQLFSFPQSHIVTNMHEQSLPYSTYAQLSEALLIHFKNYCARHQISILDGLCAVLMMALMQCTELNTNKTLPICINRVKSTRDNEDYDLAIGCFLRLEPIKLMLKKGLTLASLSQEIHEAVMHTAPFQRCSNLVKLASIGTFRQKKSLLKHYSIKLGVWLYTTLMRLKLNRTILNISGRLSSDKGTYFLINVNVQNNFVTPVHENEHVFGLKVKPVSDKQSDLLHIDHLLDVCFLRTDNNTPFLVLSANLTAEFKERLTGEMIKIMESSIT
jgi:hypothetical protein